MSAFKIPNSAELKEDLEFLDEVRKMDQNRTSIHSNMDHLKEHEFMDDKINFNKQQNDPYLTTSESLFEKLNNKDKSNEIPNSKDKSMSEVNQRKHGSLVPAQSSTEQNNVIKLPDPSKTETGAGFENQNDIEESEDSGKNYFYLNVTKREGDLITIHISELLKLNEIYPEIILKIPTSTMPTITEKPETPDKKIKTHINRDEVELIGFSEISKITDIHNYDYYLKFPCKMELKVKYNVLCSTKATKTLIALNSNHISICKKDCQLKNFEPIARLKNMN